MSLLVLSGDETIQFVVLIVSSYAGDYFKRDIKGPVCRI